LLGAQFLIFLLLFGSGIYLFWLAGSASIKAEPDAADAGHGLRLAAGMCLGLCLFWGASFLGLLRRQAWGWWLGLIANFFVFAIVSWALLFDDGGRDPEDWLVPGVFLIVTIIQIITRPTTWAFPEVPTSAPPDSQHSAGSGI